MSAKILVVDDDPELVELLVQIVQNNGFDVLHAFNGREALHVAYKAHPDLIILDLMMPEMDGWDFCCRLREITDVPILVLTALVDEKSQIRCFELGADDLMTKPFNVRELELRIMALLRRTAAFQPSPFLVFDKGKLVIDLSHCRVLKNGQEIHLSMTEFCLLRYLVCRTGQVIPHAHLIANVWGSNQIGKMSSLSFYIHKLRQKLEDDPEHPRYIVNKWGNGYQFAAISENDSSALGGRSIR